MYVKNIMIKDIITIKPDETIQKVAEKLAKENISGAPVVDNKKLIGIISEADILKHIKNTCKKFDMVYIPTPLTKLGIIDFREVESKEMEEAFIKAGKSLATDVMKRDLITTTPDEFAKNIAKLMVEKKINRLPVVENGKLVGIVTRGDIIKAITMNNKLLKKG